MKKKRFLLPFLILTGLFIWWMIHQMDRQPVEKPIRANQSAISRSSKPSAHPKKSIKHSPDGSPMTMEEHASKFEQRMKEKVEARERGLDEWRTPIEFYGRVVDENETPVAGAQIDFGTTDLSPTGTSDYESISDQHGSFSISGIRGKLLTVKINKEGYNVSKQNQNNFFYAGENENFVPDPRNPVVFHLRKKGQAEPLIVSEGIFSVSISGKPLEIDLKTGKATASGNGNLIVEFYRTPLNQTKGQSYDWSFKISVPNGGLVLSTNEFDFLVAESGYEPVQKIETPSLEKQWYGRLNQKYFLQLPDGNYGRVLIDLMTYNGSLKIQSFINPSGSRNLEPAENPQPKQTVFE